VSVKCIYIKPEAWRQVTKAYEILEWCKEAPNVKDHIAVWVKPNNSVPPTAKGERPHERGTV